MSVTTATGRLSTRRHHHGQIVAAVLLGLALIGALVAIGLSNSSSGGGVTSARPSVIRAPVATQPSAPVSPPAGVGLSTQLRGQFRDPTTHALLRVRTAPAAQAAPTGKSIGAVP